jgi:hypothetical protein
VDLRVFRVVGHGNNLVDIYLLLKATVGTGRYLRKNGLCSVRIAYKLDADSALAAPGQHRVDYWHSITPSLGRARLLRELLFYHASFTV